MIEDSFGMVGAVTEIIVMSGLDKVLKIKADKAKPFFKRYGLEFHPEFKSKPTAAHPLFADLVAAAVAHHAGVKT